MKYASLIVQKLQPRFSFYTWEVIAKIKVFATDRPKPRCPKIYSGHKKCCLNLPNNTTAVKLLYNSYHKGP